jgi:citrate-Mg2+:H+ or citrate-Ca2+:H+ symporter, CitMHS family
MLALLGVLIVGVLLVLILSNRVSPLAALVLVPVAGGLVGGFGLQVFDFVAKGVAGIASTAAMFVFAILFFGTLTDAGLMDPILARVLRAVGNRPLWVVPASALLALLVHLDGSGAVCFLVVIPALLPVYDRLAFDRRVLACAVSLAAGVNFLPWTGPMIRASSALHVPVMEIFRPMIPVQLAGLVFVFGVCGWLGLREQRRVAAGVSTAPMASMAEATAAASTTIVELRRPGLFWVNLVLALGVMGVLVAGLVPPQVAFMAGAALALVINYRSSALQRSRVEAHAKPALSMAAILFAAGAFTGVLTGTGALNAMATALVAAVPPAWGSHVPFLVSLVAMPLSMVFDPDSFYFGVLPVIAQMHGQLGGAPVQVAQAALVGQMTAGFPVSPLTPATFLVAGLTGLELSVHQRFSFKYLYAASLCMAVACIVFGVFAP